jgi:aromatic-L-amino-acid/L-tryptophan decarboxylase
MTVPRHSPLDLSPDQFRALGHRVVDRIADFLSTLPARPVSPAETPDAIRGALGRESLPRDGIDPAALMDDAASLLFEHSLFNGHPRFWAYITSSAAPIGALGELLAASVNPNVGSWSLSPVATLIEQQTVQWIAELVGYPTPCGGLLVSGGNMANLVGFWAARAAKAPGDVRTEGVGSSQLALYASVETHTWIHKAADLSGLGTDAIRWISTDAALRMEPSALRNRIRRDVEEGVRPLLVVATAGSVSTGAIDPLAEIAAICREHDLWFHVDGAYGALAAAVPDQAAAFAGMAEADSVAVDPHKWLYAPLEAGCTLVRNDETLRAAFSYRPPYYHFEAGTDAPPNYYEMGPQNSRGFRALKVWLALRQAGRAGYERMLADDIRLSRELYDLVDAEPELEAVTQGLSITTFRYVPPGDSPPDRTTEYLNRLNTQVLDRLQRSGRAYVSNAVVNGQFLLRACIVNFRTTRSDLEVLRGLVVQCGREAHRELKGAL